MKACPKLDHMTDFGFLVNRFRCLLGGSKAFSLQKPLIKDTVQMALILELNESQTAKIALWTYLRMTLNGNFVGLA